MGVHLEFPEGGVAGVRPLEAGAGVGFRRADGRARLAAAETAGAGFGGAAVVG